MASEHLIRQFRGWYTTLLRLYPTPYRQQFGEPMAQTFNDLLRERAKEEKGLFGFAVWMFVETFTEIMRKNIVMMTQNKNIVRIAVGTALILLIPLVGRLVSDDWNWGLFDFIFMGTLLFGTGLAYELVARKVGTPMYRTAVGVACVTGIFLVWVNAAVGIIGDEDLANLMYFGVLAIGVVGALATRFQPRGMSHTLVAMAIAQALVPLIAMIWVPAVNFAPGVLAVLGLNAFFVALWIGSAYLFRLASPPTAA